MIETKLWKMERSGANSGSAEEKFWGKAKDPFNATRPSTDSHVGGTKSFWKEG